MDAKLEQRAMKILSQKQYGDFGSTLAGEYWG
jgi:hypothetical protein